MEWISVKDRLPDKDGEYLCVHHIPDEIKPSIKIYSFSKDLYKTDEFGFHNLKGESGFYYYSREYGYIRLTFVSHWMPLPELPKGE